MKPFRPDLVRVSTKASSRRQSTCDTWATICLSCPDSIVEREVEEVLANDVDSIYDQVSAIVVKIVPTYVLIHTLKPVMSKM